MAAEAKQPSEGETVEHAEIANTHFITVKHDDGLTVDVDLTGVSYWEAVGIMTASLEELEAIKPIVRIVRNGKVLNEVEEDE